MLRTLLFWISKKRWLLYTIVISTVLYNMPYPVAISTNAYRTLILTLIVVMLIISESVPLPAIALLIAVLEVTFSLDAPSAVAKSFMSDAVFFIMGSLMLAVAIVKQGLDARLTLVILAITGASVRSIMWGFFLISMLLTSFMGSFTIVAMLLPVALTLVRNTSDEPEEVRELTKLLLFAIVFGSILGSSGTPSGGARNAIMIEFLSEFGLAKMSYAKWMLFTYPIILLQAPIAGWILFRSFEPKQTRLDEAVKKLREQVGESGKLNGEQILSIVFFILILIAWITLSDKIGIGIVALGGVFIYLATGLVQWEEINQRTNWGVVLLYAGMISLGMELKNTGAALWITENMLTLVGTFFTNAEAIHYFLVSSLTTLVVNVMSPSASVAVLGPIFIHFGENPVLLGMGTAVASSFGYMTVIGSPGGMIVASTGLIGSKDFLRIGGRFVLLSIIMLLFAMLVYWPILIGIL